MVEHEAGLRALVGLPPAALPEVGEHALVTEVDGVTLVCPWRTRVRACEALGEFRSELPDEIADAFVPRVVADAAQDELDQWRVDHADLHTHVLSSTWQVPLRWFLLVDPRRARGQPGRPAAPARPRPGRPAARCSTAPRCRGPGAGSPARCRCCGARSTTARSRPASRTSAAGWRSSTPARSSSSTTAAWCTCSTTPALAEDESARDLAAALAALGEGAGARRRRRTAG